MTDSSILRAVRRLARRLRMPALGLLAALAVAVLGEHLLEVRDFARLSADQTFVSLNGRRVRYRLVGQGTPGPPIVLVSGLMATAEQWHVVQAALADEAPVIAYDRGGMGFSDASSAHDAEAQAEELEGVLRGAGLSPPFVVVSYSAAALLTRLFVARHPAEVSGVVFLDPILPDSAHAGTRQFLALTLESLVGYMRIKALVHNRNRSPSSPIEEREGAILASFHHWSATAEEGLRLGNWTAALMAAPRFGPIPVGVLCTFNPEHDARTADAVAKTRCLATESPSGTFLSSPQLDHGTLVIDPVGSRQAIDLIRTVEGQARARQASTP